MAIDFKSIMISFGAGLGIGILGGKIYYEKKYQMKLNGAVFNSDKNQKAEPKQEEKVEEKPEEKPEVKEEESHQKESSELNKNKEDLSSMAQKVKEENPRIDYSTPTPSEMKHSEKPASESTGDEFVIEPEDFGDLGDEDYEVVTVLYLADHNLVYENGNKFEPVEEPQRKIGSEAVKMLKDNPSNNVVYVRNKRLKIDYEIVPDDRTLNEGYSEDDDDEYEEDR